MTLPRRRNRRPGTAAPDDAAQWLAPLITDPATVPFSVTSDPGVMPARLPGCVSPADRARPAPRRRTVRPQPPRLGPHLRGLPHHPPRHQRGQPPAARVRRAPRLRHSRRVDPRRVLAVGLPPLPADPPVLAAPHRRPRRPRRAAGEARRGARHRDGRVLAGSHRRASQLRAGPRRTRPDRRHHPARRPVHHRPDHQRQPADPDYEGRHREPRCLRDALPDAGPVAVDGNQVAFTDCGDWFEVELPRQVSEFICDFDADGRGEPFSFDLDYPAVTS